MKLRFFANFDCCCVSRLSCTCLPQIAHRVVQPTQHQPLFANDMHISDYEIRNENLPREACELMLGIDQTVHDVKKAVESELDVAIAHQELSWRGQILENKVTLKAYGFEQWTFNTITLRWSENPSSLIEM